MGKLFHGVNIEEVPTRVLPPRVVSASIPFVVGLAPIHRTKSAAADVINKPVLCNTYEEFVTQFGESDDAKYTLCEFAKVFFGLYNVGPIVVVNVLDPASDKTAVASEAAVMAAGTYTLKQDAVLSTLIVKSQDGSKTYVLDTDYTAEYDEDGYILITRLSDGAITTATSALQLSYDKIGATPCTAEDIIGGVNVMTGANEGLQCIEDVYALHSVIPGMILCPGWSKTPSVALAMAAKTTGINSLFSAIAIADVDSGAAAADQYTKVNNWKNTNSYTNGHLGVCWPKVKLDSAVYWLSSHLAGRIAATDADNGDVPYVSPSNKSLQINGLVTDNGSPVVLTIPQADTLNQQGVITGLQFNGWKCWGNRTGDYPGSTDPKDAFLSVRRMMNWIGNNVVLLLWQKLDDPLNRRTVETAVDSVNQWLNGLVARGSINAGRCEFVQGENSNVSLSDGKLTLHLYVTPPSPAEQINVILEYAVNGNSAVFGE
ncbi:MAG: phage tail sheath family protein [Armatimonadota bacterium]